MDTFEKMIASVNRYHLRFGPATISIYVYILTWIYVYKNEFIFVAEVAADYRFIIENLLWQFMAGLFVACAALSIILTWPILVLHIFRWEPQNIKLLADKRDSNLGKGSCEFVDTIRHCREYGSSLMGVGFSVLQTHWILNEFLHSTVMSSFEAPLTLICLSSVLVGLIVWGRSLALERAQLRLECIGKGSLWSVASVGVCITLLLAFGVPKVCSLRDDTRLYSAQDQYGIDKAVLPAKKK